MAERTPDYTKYTIYYFVLILFNVVPIITLYLMDNLIIIGFNISLILIILLLMFLLKHVFHFINNGLEVRKELIDHFSSMRYWSLRLKEQIKILNNEIGIPPQEYNNSLLKLKMNVYRYKFIKNVNNCYDLDMLKYIHKLSGFYNAYSDNITHMFLKNLRPYDPTGYIYMPYIYKAYFKYKIYHDDPEFKWLYMEAPDHKPIVITTREDALAYYEAQSKKYNIKRVGLIPGYQPRIIDCYKYYNLKGNEKPDWKTWWLEEQKVVLKAMEDFRSEYKQKYGVELAKEHFTLEYKL